MPRIPGYCLHKPSGRAVVNCKSLFGSKPHYLPGEYGSVESRAAYEAIRSKIVAMTFNADVAEPAMSPSAIASPTLDRVFACFLFHAERHYDRREFISYRSAMRVASKQHGGTTLNRFGPVALKEVRTAMIGMGWARSHINHQINRLRLIVKWAAEEEMEDAAVYWRLKAVAPLRAGKTDARETEPVKPVAWETAELILPFISPTVAAMVRVQYLTGMRSDELTAMRMTDVSCGGDIWIYEPKTHKNQWRGKRKLICLGPRVQSILAPYTTDDLDAYLFSPRRSVDEHGIARAAARKTKLYGKRASETPKKTRRLRDRYDAHSYLVALQNGFRKMTKKTGERRAREPAGTPLKKWLADRGIEYWHPHQLRHTRATITRGVYGVEGAQAQLGNTLEATEIYAEKSLELAIRISVETG